MIYLACITSFFLCLVLTPLIKKVAKSKGWIAHPVKDRWHKKPTALLGGIAIYISIAVPLFYISDFSSLFTVFYQNQYDINHLPSLGAVIWVGMTLLFTLGLLDDFLHIKPHTKLISQILTASMVVFLGFRMEWFISHTLDTIITIVWIVGITNAFNLMDNMDGLSAGIGLISSLTLGLIFMGSLPEISIIALILAAALAAFLIYNFNPASIFMGDCGSLIIGFIISMLTLFYAKVQSDNFLAAKAVPMIIVIVPILDTTLVSLVRVLSGRKASTGGRDHTSHRLILMGLTEKGAVLFLYGICSIAGLAAWFVNKHDTVTSPSVIIPLALSLLLMGIFLSQLRVYPEKEFSLLRDKTFTPLLLELTYKRQILMVILDFWVIAFAYYLSYRLRFDSEDFFYYFPVFLQSLPAVIACKFIAFFTIGNYRGFCQYFSTNDFSIYLKSSLLGTLLSVTVVTYIYRFSDFSKGIFIIDWLLTVFMLISSRGFFRLSDDIMKRKTVSGVNMLIYGAGRGGELLLREILNNKKHEIKPQGFIDDNPLKRGKKLQGYPVLGAFNDIDEIVRKYAIKCVVVSFKENGTTQFDKVKKICRKKELSLKRFSIFIEDVNID